MALSCCKKLSALFKGITSNHDGDFYYLNCLIINADMKCLHEKIDKCHNLKNLRQLK